jgi:hypothetical protein
MNILLIFMLMMLGQNDYAVQYAFKEPVVSNDLTYYHKMKQIESLK